MGQLMGALGKVGKQIVKGEEKRIEQKPLISAMTKMNGARKKRAASKNSGSKY